MIDWGSWLANWGPAAPFIMLFLKAHYDLVYKIVPQGFAEIKNSDTRHEKDSRRRHDEHIAVQKKILLAIEMQAKKCEKRRTKAPRRRPKK